MPRVQNPDDLTLLKEQIIRQRDSYSARVILSSGTCGQAAGALAVEKAIEKHLSTVGLRDRVDLRVTGCQGFCQQEPVLLLEPLDILYCRVKPEDVAEIVSESLEKQKVIPRLLFKDPVSGETIAKEKDIPFFAKQDRQLIGQNRWIDPCNINDYIALGGYSALAKVLTGMT